jgi:hypothetical protein
MGSSERQQLQEDWAAEHDRLSQALEEYEVKLAVVPYSEFDRLSRVASAARAASDRAREMRKEDSCPNVLNKQRVGIL